MCYHAENTSWVRSIFLNSTFLEGISPSECEKTKIQQVGQNSLQALIDTIRSHVSYKIKSTPLQKLKMSFSHILAATCIALVALSIAPLSAIFHGTKAAFHLTDCLLQRYVLRSNANLDVKWVKTSQAAHTALTDLCLFGFYAIPIVLANYFNLRASARDLIPRIIEVAVNTLWTYAIFLVCGGYRLLKQFSHIFETSDRISLYLRSKLGLVDQKGKLLNFSKEDTFEFNRHIERNAITFQFKGKDFDYFTYHIKNFECELLELIIQFNEWLKTNGKEPISFTYPFDKKAVKEKLAQDQIVLDKQTPELQKLMQRIQEKHHQIDCSKNLLSAFMRMTVEKETNFKKNLFPVQPLSLLDEEDYKKAFEQSNVGLCNPSKISNSESSIRLFIHKLPPEVVKITTYDIPLYE